MRLTYAFVIKKFEELKEFVYLSNNMIAQTINNYNKFKETNANNYFNTKTALKKEYDKDKNELLTRIDSMLGSVIEIRKEITQIEHSLIMKDKYYKKTKAKKEEELKYKKNEAYDSYTDYIEVLDKIKTDYSILSKKYRESILPGIIDGIHYLFSSKRKQDYEELIILGNTIDSFIIEIKKNINDIKRDAIEGLDIKYETSIKEFESKNKILLANAQKKYQDDISLITDTIESKLNEIFPNDLLNRMKTQIYTYQDSLNNIYDKKITSKSVLSLYCVYLPISQLGALGSVYDFMTDKLKELIIETEAGDFLLMPSVSYFDESSNWFLKWDNTNREYIHELANNIMYSALTHIPVDQLKFLIIDPENHGASIKSYYDAKKKICDLFYDKIYVNTPDIYEQLNKISNFIDEISQDILGTNYNSIFDYSENVENYVPQITYIVIYDFPKGINDSVLELLNNIIRQGPKCGFYTIIVESYDDTDQTHSKLFEKTKNEICSQCNFVNVINQKMIMNQKTIALLAEMPNKFVFSNYVDRYLLMKESIKNKSLVFSSLIKRLLDSKNKDDSLEQIKVIKEFMINVEKYNCFSYENDILMPEMLSIGNIKYPSAIFQNNYCYDEIITEFSDNLNYVTMPFILELKKHINLMLISDEENYNEIVKFSYNIIYSFLSYIPVGLLKINIVDLEGRGKNARPFLDFISKRPDVFEGGLIVSAEQFRKKINDFNTKISDIILKKLGSNYDTIIDYNSKENKEKEPIRLMIIYGFPETIDDVSLSDLSHILKDGNECGIYTIFCSRKKNGDSNLYVDEINNMCTRFEKVNGGFKLVPFNVLLDDNKIFTQNSMDDFISKYISELEVIDEREKNKAPENDYTSLFDLTKAPIYNRGNKHLHLPYGISADGDIYYCDFEKDNFAAFLCGSSGSGKSTLLHSLINGILMNNHPDDVEIWLADFKKKEFSRYINNCPPHIKYIFLEESSDAVYDFLDKMKEKLSERERLNNAVSDMAEAPVSMYMPLIFVIIDEFSIMSQIIDENMDYKLILQNLLAKGRALGFRFLFSSQTFTTGITGLTLTAKKQIQMRLAMKCPQEEISETIDMNKSLMTEEQKRWLLTLPKYYILLKKLVGEGDVVSNGQVQDEVILTRAKGLYFPDYEIQNEFIRKLNQNYKSSSEYNPSDLMTYKNKYPVIVDGRVFYSFDDVKDDIFDRINYLEKTSDFIGTSNLFLGRPRSMQKVREISIENEFEENIILFGTDVELMVSVYLSAMESLQYSEATVTFLGYNRNKICKRLEAFKKEYMDEYITDELEISKLIADVRQEIERGIQGNHFIFIVGLDVILKNAEFISNSSHIRRSKNNDVSSSLNNLDKVMDNSNPDMSFEEVLSKYINDNNITLPKEDEIQAKAVVNNTSTSNENEESVNKSISSIRENLDFILKEGPRFGYHIFAGFRSYDEFKQTRFSIDLFRHRVTFKCSKDNSRDIIAKSSAFNLDDIAFIYTDLQTTFSMRPFLHKGLSWENWSTDDLGHATNNVIF